MAKRTTYLGSISLLKTKKGEGLVSEPIMHNGKKGIFISIDDNPAIYYKKNEDGTRTCNLDIEVKPVTNSQFSNSHMIKLNVGKENRQKFNIQGAQMKDHTPIVGNLKAFEFEDRSSQGDDLPAGNTPEQFDTDW